MKHGKGWNGRRPCSRQKDYNTGKSTTALHTENLHCSEFHELLCSPEYVKRLCTIVKDTDVCCCCCCVCIEARNLATALHSGTLRSVTASE